MRFLYFLVPQKKTTPTDLQRAFLEKRESGGKKSNTVCSLINFLALLLCHLPASSAPTLVLLIFLPSFPSLPFHGDVTNVTDKPGRIAPSFFPPCSHFTSAALALPGGNPSPWNPMQDPLDESPGRLAHPDTSGEAFKHSLFN